MDVGAEGDYIPIAIGLIGLSRDGEGGGAEGDYIPIAIGLIFLSL